MSQEMSQDEARALVALRLAKELYSSLPPSKIAKYWIVYRALANACWWQLQSTNAYSAVFAGVPRLALYHLPVGPELSDDKPIGSP
jgi:hypothetical protein